MVGLDTALYEGCDLRLFRLRPRPRSAETSATSTPADLEGCRRRRPPRRALERPAGRARREPHLRDQPRSQRPARTSSLGPPVSSASSSRPRAACTAPRAARTPVDETAPLAPLTAYASSKVRAERSLAELASDELLSRSFFALPPPTASRRGCASTSCSTTSSAQRVADRGGPPSERRHRLAAAHPCRGHGTRMRRRARRARGR